jgi:hypothetical protein
MRRRGENYTDVILRLAKGERSSERRDKGLLDARFAL